MLTIRMQRTGRKGFATFRVVVQDSRFSPTSGRVVAQVGHSNPHTKETVLDIEKIQKYLDNGAQPSPRVVRLLQAEKVKLPAWVEVPTADKAGKTRNPEKLRKNQPKEEPAPEAEEAPAEEPAAEEVPAEEKTKESASEEAPAADESAETEEKPEA